MAWGKVERLASTENVNWPGVPAAATTAPRGPPGRQTAQARGDANAEPVHFFAQGLAVVPFWCRLSSRPGNIPAAVVCPLSDSRCRSAA